MVDHSFRRSQLISTNQTFLINHIKGLIKREGMQLPIDGKIKSVANNSNTKLELLVYWGYWGSISLSLHDVAKNIVMLIISPLNELHALSLYKPLTMLCIGVVYVIFAV